MITEISGRPRKKEILVTRADIARCSSCAPDPVSAICVYPNTHSSATIRESRTHVRTRRPVWISSDVQYPADTHLAESDTQPVHILHIENTRFTIFRLVLRAARSCFTLTSGAARAGKVRSYSSGGVSPAGSRHGPVT